MVKGEYAQLRPVLFTGCDPMKVIQPRVFVWPGDGLFTREVVVQLFLVGMAGAQPWRDTTNAPQAFA